MISLLFSSTTFYNNPSQPAQPDPIISKRLDKRFSSKKPKTLSWKRLPENTCVISSRNQWLSIIYSEKFKWIIEWSWAFDCMWRQTHSSGSYWYVRVWLELIWKNLFCSFSTLVSFGLELCRALKVGISRAIRFQDIIDKMSIVVSADKSESKL